MENNQAYLENKIKLLTFLLNHEVLDRQMISDEHHHAYGGLTGARVYLRLIAKHGDKIEPIVKQMTSVLNETVDQMRSINRAIYSKDTQNAGIVSGINASINRLAAKYKCGIVNLSAIEHRLNISLLREIGIFLVCHSTIEFLCQYPGNSISVNLVLSNNNLVFTCIGAESEIPAETKGFADNLLQVVEGRVLWQEATPLPETNWKNSFVFAFKLIEESA